MDGHAQWTLDLLVDTMVELTIVDAISEKQSEGSLKNELKPCQRQYWVIPTQQNTEFVAHMEDVLDLYHRPMIRKFL